MTFFKIKKSTDAEIELRLRLIASEFFVNFACSFLLLLIALLRRRFCITSSSDVFEWEILNAKINNKFICNFLDH